MYIPFYLLCIKPGREIKRETDRKTGGRMGKLSGKCVKVSFLANIPPSNDAELANGGLTGSSANTGLRFASPTIQ